MYRKYALISLCLAFCSECEAQPDKKIELSIVPALGFNVSLPAFDPRSTNKHLSYTQSTKSIKDGYAGIGIQVQFWDEWQATVKIANTAYGSGWKYAIPSSTPNLSSTGSHSYSSVVNLIDFTTERSVFSTGNMYVLHQKLKVRFQALVGIRYNWVPKVNRTDSVLSISSINHNFNVYGYDSVKILRNASGGLSVGANAQLYFNGHRSLKIGAMYTFAPSPLFEFRTEVNYFGTDTDKFKTHGGQHQLLFYVEYPIRFYSIKKK
jgi:hypothetical protein